MSVTDYVSISLDIGAELEFKVSFGDGKGAFPIGLFLEEDIYKYNGREYKLFNKGFALEDTEVGVLYDITDSECLAVMYKHNQPKNNTVWFFASDGRISKVDIINVPIHDHSTVYQGGPALGTYASKHTLQR